MTRVVRWTCLRPHTRTPVGPTSPLYIPPRLASYINLNQIVHIFRPFLMLLSHIFTMPVELTNLLDDAAHASWPADTPSNDGDLRSSAFAELSYVC